MVLLKILDSTAMGDRFPHYIINDLTWTRHEVFDSIRDDGVWSGVKDVLKPVGTASLIDECKLMLRANMPKLRSKLSARLQRQKAKINSMVMSIAASVLKKQLGL